MEETLQRHLVGVPVQTSFLKVCGVQKKMRLCSVAQISPRFLVVPVISCRAFCTQQAARLFPGQNGHLDSLVGLTGGVALIATSRVLALDWPVVGWLPVHTSRPGAVVLHPLSAGVSWHGWSGEGGVRGGVKGRALTSWIPMKFWQASIC